MVSNNKRPAVLGHLFSILSNMLCYPHVVDLSSLRLTGQSAMPVHHEKHRHSSPHRQEEANVRRIDAKAFED